MEILKAQEILDLNIKTAGKKMPPDTLVALQMARHALSRITTMRSYNNHQALLPLMGETKGHGKPVKLDHLMRIKESPIGTEPKG